MALCVLRRPSNVLLFESGHGFPVAKVADFGISKPVDMTTHFTTQAFTAPYAAPEVLWPSLGPARSSVDVYSFGVLMGALLTQLSPRVPDIRKHAPETAPPRHTAAALSVSGAPPDVLDLHAACVSLDATKRPTFTAIVDRLLEQAAALREAERRHGVAGVLW